MFARVHTLFLFSALALFSTATSTAVFPRGDTCNANTGTQHCCNSVQESSESVVKILGGLFGDKLGSVSGMVGVNCSPIVGGTSCNSQAVCCNGNTFNGAIVVGCSPINA